MEEDEIQLPSLPRASSNPQLPRSQLFRLTSRKRSTRSDELQDDDVLSNSLHTSSDPALFSSDETPDAENYFGSKRRKKKTYAGTWWGERLRSASSKESSCHRGKREFTRNFDSGIFMNSDDASMASSSDSSFGNDLIEAQRQEARQEERPRTPLKAKVKLATTLEIVSPQSPKKVIKIVQQDRRDQFVMEIVRRCLDESKEDVDLSGMELERLPLEIRELSTMIRGDPSNEIHFDSLVARPRLYLSTNIFRQFPTPLLDLTNMRLLSLRQNKLTRLPPGIRNLVKLETLNISANRFQSLPVEILDLMNNNRLSELLSEPNPWLEPSKEQIQALKRAPRLPNRTAFFSQYKRSQQTGDEVSLILLLSATSEDRPALPQIAHQGSTKVPALSEMILRQLAKVNNSKRDLAPLMAQDTPPNVLQLLNDLHRAQSEGDRKCANCKRIYVRPAATWIEWWDISHVSRNHAKPATSVGLFDEQALTEVQREHGVGKHTLPFEIGICGNCA